MCNCILQQYISNDCQSTSILVYDIIIYFNIIMTIIIIGNAKYYSTLSAEKYRFLYNFHI